MSYNFKIKGPWWKVKETKKYPWPCKSLPNRTIEIFDDDILNKTSPGVYTKITGLGCMNILIPDEDTIEMNEEQHLTMYNL